MIKPNLPINSITKCIVSSETSDKILRKLSELNISTVKAFGRMNCDKAIRQHTDLYTIHISEKSLLFAKNICSFQGEIPNSFLGVDIDFPCEYKKYPSDVFFNCVVIGNDLICNTKTVHKKVLDYTEDSKLKIINVNQGYAKCNICVVDEGSVITEDCGIASILNKYGYDVLLLKNHCVRLPGYEYGFIGGASGKLAKDKLAFFGCIENHTEFGRIYDFLNRKGIEAVSLSDEPITDYGSLIPIE